MRAIKFVAIGIVLSIFFGYVSLEFIGAVYPNNAVVIALIFSVLFSFGSSGYYVYKYKASDSENT